VAQKKIRKKRRATPEEPERKPRAAPADAEEKEETTMPRFEVGQKVKFRPIQNKALELTGVISAISDDDPDQLTVTAEVDGKNIEVERDFDARAEDTREDDD
jgi:hypothetical protein